MSYFIVTTDVLTSTNKLNFTNNETTLTVAEFTSSFYNTTTVQYVNLINTVGYIFNKLYQNQALNTSTYTLLLNAFDRLISNSISASQVIDTIGTFFDGIQVENTLDYLILSNDNQSTEGLFYNTNTENLGISVNVNRSGAITNLINYKTLNELQLSYSFQSQSMYETVFNNINTYINSLLLVNEYYQNNYDQLVESLSFFISSYISGQQLSNANIFANINYDSIEDTTNSEEAPESSVNEDIVTAPETTVVEEEVTLPSESTAEEEVDPTLVEEEVTVINTVVEEEVTLPDDSTNENELDDTTVVEEVIVPDTSTNEENVTLPDTSFNENEVDSTVVEDTVVSPPTSVNEEQVTIIPEPTSVNEETVEASLVDTPFEINEEIVEL